MFVFQGFVATGVLAVKWKTSSHVLKTQPSLTQPSTSIRGFCNLVACLTFEFAHPEFDAKRSMPNHDDGAILDDVVLAAVLALPSCAEQ